MKKRPNKAVEPTIMAVTFRAPSSTNRASHDRGSLLTLGKMKRLLFLILVSLCGCAPNPPSHDDVIAYFRRYERQLNELVALGEANAALRRAEPALAKFPDYYGRPSTEDLKAQEVAYRILDEINADSIAWWRTKDGRIFQATVPVYRWGLSLGGFSKSLEYVPGYREKPPRSDERQRYSQIGDTPWFICESDTR